MTSDKPQGHVLFSKRLRAGTRQYYIDAKTDSKGAKYIVLSETKAQPSEGKSERHRIFIYEEDFAKVLHGLHELMQALSTAPLELKPSESEGLSEEMELQQINIQWEDEAMGVEA